MKKFILMAALYIGGSLTFAQGQENCINYTRVTVANTDETSIKRTKFCTDAQESYLTMNNAFYEVVDAKLDKEKDYLFLKAIKGDMLYLFLLDDKGRLFVTAENTKVVLMFHR